MFRNLGMLRKNILLSRAIHSRCTLMANMVTSTGMRSKVRDSPNSRISVTDINVNDLAAGDVEFTRNFLTTLPSLEKIGISCGTAGVDPSIQPEMGVVHESPHSSGGSEVGNVNTNVLDRDGLPIVPIEIDGWKNADEEEGTTVQNSTEHVEIGNDSEYKAEKLLVVPEKREGRFEYKGIKVKLPRNAFKNVGTYRFRRDQEDLDTVADDMRVVKFDKK